MKKMKKYLALLLAAAMALSLFACGDASAPVTEGEQEDVLVLRYGNAAQDSTASAKNAMMFAEVLEEVSGGKMKVDYIGNATLGDQTQHYAMIKEGSLDLMQSSFDSFASLEKGEDFAVVVAPYLFDNNEHLGKFVESDIYKTMMAPVEEANNFHVVGICTYALPRCLNTTYPCANLDDVKGLRIRLSNSPAMLAIWKAWGADPQVMSPPEVYSAMENGLLDAQDNDVMNTYMASFGEVAPYYTELNYINQCYLMFCSTPTWEKLTDEQKAWMEEANALTCERFTEWFLGQYEESVNGMKEQGVTFVEFDEESFRAAGDTFCKEQDGVLWSEGLYEKIRALA